MLNIGVIGYGARVRGMLSLMGRFAQGTCVSAIVDPRAKEIKKQLGAAGKKIRYYDSPDRMFAKEDLNGVAIGTRCSLHARYACEVARRDLPLFLEKPIATSQSDLQKLKLAFRNYKSHVVVSFPLRLTSLVQTARKLIDDDVIGSVEHVQAYNNVTYGDCYFMSWYRDEKETGGLFLQKATHDFDYINYLLEPRQPQLIAAMASKQIYKGDMPAGMTCAECPADKQEKCMESPFNRFYKRALTKEVAPSKLLCGFAKDTGNEDSSSALIRYDSGMHVSYSQNFFARLKAGTRGARLLGYKGTLEFDWYTAQLKVMAHHTGLVTTHAFDAQGGHGGGDEELALNFIRIMQGREASKSPLRAGILSATMCLQARESARTHTMQKINA